VHALDFDEGQLIPGDVCGHETTSGLPSNAYGIGRHAALQRKSPARDTAKKGNSHLDLNAATGGDFCSVAQPR